VRPKDDNTLLSTPVLGLLNSMISMSLESSNRFSSGMAANPADTEAPHVTRLKKNEVGHGAAVRVCKQKALHCEKSQFQE